MPEKSIIERLSEPLTSKDVSLFCKKVHLTQKGKYLAHLLPFVTSAKIIQKLNDCCFLGWKDRYFRDEGGKGGLCCGISVFDDRVKEWVERIDVGEPKKFESKKSEYSDALKRAARRFGIANELSGLPSFFIELESNEIMTDLQNPKEKVLNIYEVDMKMWKLSYIFKDGEFLNIEITDHNRVKRWPK